MTGASSKCICGIQLPEKLLIHYFIWKLSRLSRNFPDHPVNIQPIRKLSRLSRNFPDHPVNIQPIQKLSRLFGNFPGYPETFRIIQKLSSLSGNFPGYPETFQTIRKISRLSGNSGNFPVQFQGLRAKTFRTRKKLSGWQCHPATQIFGPLVLCMCRKLLDLKKDKTDFVHIVFNGRNLY